MRKIKSRTSFDVGLLPTCVLAREISRQYKRKPARCHRTTASGVTTISDCFHPDQNRRTATQKILSSGPILGLGCRRFSTASCWRKARFSRRRLRRARKRRTSVPRHTAIIRNMASSYNRTAREGDSHVIDFPDGRSFGEPHRMSTERSPHGDRAPGRLIRFHGASAGRRQLISSCNCREMMSRTSVSADRTKK